jgi:hypothetical protein
VTATAIDREAAPSRQVEMIEQIIGAAMDGSRAWVFELAALVRANELHHEVARRACSNLAWMSRYLGHQPPGDDDWAACAQSDDPRGTRLILAYVHGFRLRFDLKFSELARRCDQWLADVPGDALLHSFRAFAALGARSEDAVALLRYATVRPDYDSVCRWVCLHGLWFATDLPDQPQRIVALSDEIIARGEVAANLYYWRASALRRLGQVTAALTNIDKAIDLLPTGSTSTHQDYLHERELIAAAGRLQDHTESLHGQLTGAVRDQLGAALHEQFTVELRERLTETVRAELRDQLADTIQAELSAQMPRVIVELGQRVDVAPRLAAEYYRTMVNISRMLTVLLTLALYLIAATVIVLRTSDIHDQVRSVGLAVGGGVLLFLVLSTLTALGRGWRRRRAARARTRTPKPPKPAKEPKRPKEPEQSTEPTPRHTRGAAD